MRMRSSVKPRATRTSAGMLACDMKHGRLINDFTLPATFISSEPVRYRIDLNLKIEILLVLLNGRLMHAWYECSQSDQKQEVREQVREETKAHGNAE